MGACDPAVKIPAQLGRPHREISPCWKRRSPILDRGYFWRIIPSRCAAVTASIRVWTASLGQDRRNVVVDRLGGEEKPFRNVSVAEAGGDESEHLNLTRGEVLGRVDGVGPSPLVQLCAGPVREQIEPPQFDPALVTITAAA